MNLIKHISLSKTYTLFVLIHIYNITYTQQIDQATLHKQQVLEYATEVAQTIRNTIHYWQLEHLQTLQTWHNRSLNHTILPHHYNQTARQNIDDLINLQKQMYNLIGSILVNQNSEHIHLNDYYQDCRVIVKKIESLKEPSHAQKYKKWYIGASIATVLSAIYYMQNQNSCHAFFNKAQDATIHSAQTYITQPLIHLKNLLWHKQTMKLEPLSSSATINHQRSFKTYLVDDSIFEVATMIDQSKKEFISWFNQNCTTIFDQCIARQELTLAIIAAIPACMCLYSAGKAINHTYRQHFKHENWHVIIKNIIFEMDRLLNQAYNDQTVIISKECTGHLYVLIKTIETYIPCLQGLDRIQFQRDLDELQDLQYSVSQKYNVVQRMYKQYSFLK